MNKNKKKKQKIISNNKIINGCVITPIEFEICDLSSKNPVRWLKEKERSWFDYCILK